jgi:hypothetical protein
MIANLLRSSDAVTVVNVALAALCCGAALAVLVAVACDVCARRKDRIVIPDCWPPKGHETLLP